MRKLLLFILSFILCQAYLEAYELYHTENAPTDFDSTNVMIYEYYLGWQTGNPINHLWPIRFRRDFKCEIPGYQGVDNADGYSDTSGIIGEWRISHDTLFIYEDFIDSTNTDWVEAFKNDMDSLQYLTIKAPRYRNLFIPDWDYEFNYPANVGLFWIQNYGEIIVSPPSSGANIILYHCSKSQYYGFSKRFGSSWERIKFNWQNNCYVVVDKLIYNNCTILITIENCGIEFTIVNPDCFFKEYITPELIAEAPNPNTYWMDTVTVGKSYNLNLFRPTYNTNKKPHPLQYLNCSPDSLYISRGDTLREAYGYFFARIIPDSINRQ